MTKFKDVAHLYLGCPCETPFGVLSLSNVHSKGRYKYWFTSDNKENEEIIIGNGLRGRAFDISEFKPILRPLSSISKDEEAEISKLYFEFMETQYKGTRDCRMMAHVTKWYLSKHFDLFSLIDSGEAITTHSDYEAQSNQKK